MKELNKCYAAMGRAPHGTLTVVSPSTHFLNTPMLPMIAVGKADSKEALEPIADQLRPARPAAAHAPAARHPPQPPRHPPQATANPPSTTPWACRRSAGDAFLRARALKVDPARRVVTCQRSDVPPGEAAELEVAYDTLVVAVGGNSNMPAGAQGVAEHCLPLRSLPDAQNVHRRLLACFEMAARPGISAEERAALLSLVVVGGGPTGLEVAAQLYDQAGLGLGSFGRNRAHAVCTDSLPCFPAARRTRCARRCCRTVRRTACP